MVKKNMKSIAVVFLAAVLAVSCATSPVVIPEDLEPMELIQRAQEASDRYRYSVSLQYYETLIHRFPYDIDSVIAAEYEIAFINYKQSRYSLARTQFTNLLARYDTPDAVLLPPQFRVLSERILADINDRTDIRRRFFRFGRR